MKENQVKYMDVIILVFGKNIDYGYLKKLQDFARIIERRSIIEAGYDFDALKALDISINNAIRWVKIFTWLIKIACVLGTIVFFIALITSYKS